jgi:hypothetical protein
MPAPVTYVPPPFALRSAQAAEAWERSLPISAQLALKANVVPWIQKQPPAQRHRMARYLVANGIAVPPELNLDGLGPGMGQWGALLSAGISAAASTAAQIYTAKQAGKLSASEASQSNATQAQIAQIQNQAAVAAAAITSGATVQAAQQAAGADVSIAKVKGATTTTDMPLIMKWGAVAVVGIAAIGFLAWMMKSKRTSSPSAAPAAPVAAPAAA